MPSAIAMTREQVRRWNEAIAKRHSVRTFDGLPLGRTAVDALDTLEPEEIGKARVRHVLVEGEAATQAIFKGLVGGYGKLTGVPALAAFVAQTQDYGHLVALGYLGQQVVLEATSLGLATCWVSGAFSRDSARKFIELAEGEAVIAVTPVGREHQGSALRRWHDRSLKVLAGSQARKPLEQIATGARDEPRAWAALATARWAPSAANRQPWRFSVEPGRLRIRYEAASRQLPGGENAALLDCGIVMADFAVAARARGLWGSWNLLPGIGDWLAEYVWQ